MREDQMPQNVPPKKMRAVEILLTGVSLTEAAAQLKINRKTLTRWLSEEAFQTEFQEARRQLSSQGNARIVGLMDTAITSIKDALDGKGIGKEKFLASKLVIETAHQIAQDDLLSRVEALEQDVRDRQIGLDKQLEGLSLEQLEERLRRLREIDFADLASGLGADRTQ
jgi:hypothetical protein